MPNWPLNFFLHLQQTHATRTHFAARRYASTVYAMPAVCRVCLCPSVSVYVRYKSGFYRNSWPNRAGFFFAWEFLSTYDLSDTVCVIKKFRNSKNKATSFWNFFPNCTGLRKFRHSKSMVLSIKLVDGRVFGSHQHGRGVVTGRTYTTSCLKKRHPILSRITQSKINRF